MEILLRGTPPIDNGRVATTCERQQREDGDWICHHCGSLWTEMLNGTGWLPLSCPARKTAQNR